MGEHGHNNCSHDHIHEEEAIEGEVLFLQGGVVEVELGIGNCIVQGGFVVVECGGAKYCAEVVAVRDCFGGGVSIKLRRGLDPVTFKPVAALPYTNKI